jgi:hypothetical protein
VLRLRPILLRLLAAGLIGAVVTVGVAVGCAMRARPPGPAATVWKYWSNTTSTRSISWMARGNGLGTSESVLLGDDGGYRVRADFEQRVEDPPFPIGAMPGSSFDGFRRIRTVGWPCACLWGGVDLPGSGTVAAWPLTGRHPSVPSSFGSMSIGWPIDPANSRGICGYLPATPIWSGLAIDTLFYGTIAWALLFAPGAIRRVRRRRRGQCVQCGYDRAGLAAGAACPECGSP